jgi:hypothetical protein
MPPGFSGRDAFHRVPLLGDDLRDAVKYVPS